MTTNVPLETQFLDEAPSFSEEELQRIRKGHVPAHVAIIPDGNRRWAKGEQNSKTAGHLEGADSVTKIVKAAKEIGVKVITIYGFSTENWSRPKAEVTILLRLIAHNLKHQCESMVRFGVKLEVIGNIDGLPSYLQKAIEDTREATKDCTGITLVFALNYGGRDDIIRAIDKMNTDIKAGTLDQVSEQALSERLDTRPYGDPDLLIRTSGEMRVSNFLLWQLSYAEIYVTDTLWPAFRPKHFYDAVLEYQKRERRLGGT